MAAVANAKIIKICVIAAKKAQTAYFSVLLFTLWGLFSVFISPF